MGAIPAAALVVGLLAGALEAEVPRPPAGVPEAGDRDGRRGAASGPRGPGKIVQLPGPRVPPAVPPVPRPVFPVLPVLPVPVMPPPPPAPAPAPEVTPQPSARPAAPWSPAVSATTGRVTLTGTTRRGEETVLLAEDEQGRAIELVLPDYAGILGPQAQRLQPEDLRPGDPLEVSWFPDQGRRRLLIVRRLR